MQLLLATSESSKSDVSMASWFSTIAIAEHSGQAEISSTGTTGPQYSLVSQRPALPKARASIRIGW